ncbi:MAG: hypothetical protein LBU16_01460 [Treponema sp.]|jgi:hypothetical protein|nr:hypothetical protein [Treponema sp.]
MNMTNRRLLSCAGVIAALTLASCASQPPLAASSAAGGEFAYLAAGGLAYFYTDVRLSRPILEKLSIRGIDMVRTGRFLNKVDFLAGAMYPREAPQQLLLHAWKEKGAVPSASALFFSTKWEKTASPAGRNYYHSQSYGISVSTEGSHAFVSDADPFAFEPAVAVPDGMSELRWEAIVLGWLDHAGTSINTFLSAAGMPVRVPTDRILFGVYRFQNTEADTVDAIDDEEPAYRAVRTGVPRYELRLRVETENANQAKALATLLAFIRSFMENPEINAEAEYLEALRLLLANPPSQDGSNLLLHTEPMDAERIALLFNRFSVYSQQTTL